MGSASKSSMAALNAENAREAVCDYGEDLFLNELKKELRSRRYRTTFVRGVTYQSLDNPAEEYSQSPCKRINIVESLASLVDFDSIC